MKYGVRSDVGRVRRTNQDAYWIQGHRFAVADGMGGHQAGEVASAMAIQELETFGWGTNPQEELLAALKKANRIVWEASTQRAELRGMGTTATVAVVEGHTLWLGHVGDSRAYLIQDGKIEQLTDDHSVVGELMRNGGLDPLEARTHPQRNVLTRALGTSDDVGIDISKVSLGAGAILLLCTDGLTSVVDDDEILAAAVDPPGLAVDRLVNLANRRGGPDNITVLIVHL